jgi:hypothetical protein
MEEILDEKDLNVTELNHLIYAAVTVITVEINGTAEYKIETQRSKPPLRVRCIQGNINDIRKELISVGGNKKRQQKGTEHKEN